MGKLVVNLNAAQGPQTTPAPQQPAWPAKTVADTFPSERAENSVARTTSADTGVYSQWRVDADSSGEQPRPSGGPMDSSPKGLLSRVVTSTGLTWRVR